MPYQWFCIFCVGWCFLVVNVSSYIRKPFLNCFSLLVGWVWQTLIRNYDNIGPKCEIAWQSPDMEKDEEFLQSFFSSCLFCYYLWYLLLTHRAELNRGLKETSHNKPQLVWPEHPWLSILCCSWLTGHGVTWIWWLYLNYNWIPPALLIYSHSELMCMLGFALSGLSWSTVS